MSRTQISLDPYLQKQARAKAAELGISFAEYVRRLVAADLVGERRRVDISEMFDLGDSGGSDVARYKDEYLAQAVDELHREKEARRNQGSA
jgi:hypothetical protein